MHRVDLHGRRCRLFTNDTRIPKLDVAGSIPVSRSMFSISYRRIADFPGLLNALRALTEGLQDFDSMAVCRSNASRIRWHSCEPLGGRVLHRRVEMQQYGHEVKVVLRQTLPQ